MFGLGSGSHNREKWAHRLTTSDCASYRLRDLLAEGQSLPKHDDGTRTIAVHALGPLPGTPLARVWRDWFAEPRPLPSSIAVRPIPQRFGGVRWLLVCPSCYKRAGKLYAHPRFGDRCLVCRTCGDLTYAIRRIDSMSRLHAGAAKWEYRVRHRVTFDGLPSYPRVGPTRRVHPFAGKPKGMHWSTFHRLRGKLFEYEERYSGLLEERLLRPWHTTG